MSAYKLNSDNVRELVSKPETGMGYQIISATKDYLHKEYVVFNSEFAFEKIGLSIEVSEKLLWHLQAKSYTFSQIVERESKPITLSNIELKNYSEHLLAEKDKGAKDADKEPANGVMNYLFVFQLLKTIKELTKRINVCYLVLLLLLHLTHSDARLNMITLMNDMLCQTN